MHIRNKQCEIERRNNQNRIGFEELGLDKVCLRCAKSNHLANDCQINRHNVNFKTCKLSGHIQKVCIKILLSSKRSNSPKLTDLNSQAANL